MTECNTPLMFEVSISETGHKSKIVLNGIDITNHVAGINIDAGVDQFTNVRLNLQGVTVNCVEKTD